MGAALPCKGACLSKQLSIPSQLTKEPVMKIDASVLDPLGRYNVRPSAQGRRGVARWCTMRFRDLQVRMVEYSPGYLAGSLWVQQGPCAALPRGAARRAAGWPRLLHPDAGRSYQVADNAEPHRSYSELGAPSLSSTEPLSFPLPLAAIRNLP